MKIVVGETTLEATSCKPYRYTAGKLVLQISVPDGVIGVDDFATLLKSNTSDIQVLDDDNNIVGAYVGFRQSADVTRKNDNSVYAEVENTSEAAFQNSIYQQKIVAQDETIAQQEAEIEMLNDTLLVVIMG